MADSAPMMEIILQQKLSFLETASSISMSWWVSSVVFCASILAAVWVRRDEIVRANVLWLLGPVLTIFFSTVVAYGTIVIIYTCKLEKEIDAILENYRWPYASFSNEIFSVQIAVFNGTTSFFFILLAWLTLWIGLSRGKWAAREKQTD